MEENQLTEHHEIVKKSAQIRNAGAFVIRFQLRFHLFVQLLEVLLDSFGNDFPRFLQAINCVSLETGKNRAKRRKILDGSAFFGHFDPLKSVLTPAGNVTN